MVRPLRLLSTARVKFIAPGMYLVVRVVHSLAVSSTRKLKVWGWKFVSSGWNILCACTVGHGGPTYKELFFIDKPHKITSKTEHKPFYRPRSVRDPSWNAQDNRKHATRLWMHRMTYQYVRTWIRRLTAGAEFWLSASTSYQLSASSFLITSWITKQNFLVSTSTPITDNMLLPVPVFLLVTCWKPNILSIS